MMVNGSESWSCYGDGLTEVVYNLIPLQPSDAFSEQFDFENDSYLWILFFYFFIFNFCEK